MRLLFIVLTHEKLQDTLELSQSLVRSGQDASVYIHVDANVPREAFEKTCEGMHDPRIKLVSNRVRCGWGMFGLVEAVHNALEEAEANEQPFDYALLLSESCLPTRPIAHLERFLQDNPLDYIEAQDASWIRDGLRHERHSWYFPFNFKTQPKLSRLSNDLQKRFGVRRRFPDQLTPRFGSQWWALRWSTCLKILDYWRKNPRTIDFFRSVWIPDEMFFQTIVSKLIPTSEIAQKNLTFVRFTDRGKPIVYFDDHIDYVLGTPRFFIRKVNEAKRLRAACFERASAAKTPYAPAPLDEPVNNYELRRISNTWFPKPGHIFYRNQYDDTARGIIKTLRREIVILLGPEPLTRHVARSFDPGRFTVLGQLFDPSRVDFGVHGEHFEGLSSSDVELRDYNKALYLARVAERCRQTPVVLWRPDHANDVFWTIKDAENVVLVVLRPHLGARWIEDRVLNALCDERSHLFASEPVGLRRAGMAYLNNGRNIADIVHQAMISHDQPNPRALAIPFGLADMRPARQRIFNHAFQSDGVPQSVLEAATTAWRDIDEVGHPLTHSALDLIGEVHFASERTSCSQPSERTSRLGDSTETWPSLTPSRVRN